MANAAPKKKKKKKKKGMPIGLILSLIFIVGLPVGGLIVWYFATAALSVTGSKLSASEMVSANIAKVQGAMLDDLKERSKREGFSLDRVDGCKVIASQYRLSESTQPSDILDRKLLGISKRADAEVLMERCILYAQIVNRMEKLSHHTRHVVMCNDTEFTSDASGRFKIMPDPDGKGLIESFSGLEKLIEIPRGSHKLIRQWQIFNIGDGCIVVGISNPGLFSLTQN